MNIKNRNYSVLAYSLRKACHPKRSEGILYADWEIPHLVQNDSLIRY